MVSKMVTWVDRKALTKQIEFDIWDSGYVQGQRDAKAWAIKLLEELQDTFADPQYSTTGGYAEIFALRQGIALVNGQKDNETVVFLTREQAEQLAEAILEE